MSHDELVRGVGQMDAQMRPQERPDLKPREIVPDEVQLEPPGLYVDNGLQQADEFRCGGRGSGPTTSPVRVFSVAQSDSAYVGGLESVAFGDNRAAGRAGR